mgnify:CR=1 FL=1
MNGLEGKQQPSIGVCRITKRTKIRPHSMAEIPCLHVTTPYMQDVDSTFFLQPQGVQKAIEGIVSVVRTGKLQQGLSFFRMDARQGWNFHQCHLLCPAIADHSNPKGNEEEYYFSHRAVLSGNSTSSKPVRKR